MPSPAPTLATLCHRDPGSEALRDHRRRLTWGELEDRTNAIGHGLGSLGVRPGDHVALVATNRAEFVELLLAALRCGAVLTPLKTSWTGAELGLVLDDAGSVLVVTDTDGGRRAAAASGVPILDLDADFDAWVGSQSPSPLGAELGGWRMSFTSGTTGRPKGVARSRDLGVPFCESFPRSAGWARMLGFPDDAPHLVVSRLFHGAPLSFGLSALALGAPLRILDRWEPAHALEAMGDGVASSSWVPSQFRAVLGLPEEMRAAFDPSGLRTVAHGGEPCPEELKRRVLSWWGPVLTEYYGCSEGGMTLATPEQWLERPGTVGLPVPGQRIRILDDDGNDVPAGVEGRVFFEYESGRAFRYANDDAKTERAHVGAAFTAGDLGRLDDDGFLFLSGRSSEVIVTAGVNVYPAEIEAALSDVPGLADLAVVAGPDELRGEQPVAFVAVEPGADERTVLADVSAAAEARLAAEKRPRDVRVVASIPRDPTGKLLRGRLEEQLWGDRPRFAG
ncbi:MAG: AMP-binding protein [Acidimicrobiia bacterium]